MEHDAHNHDDRGSRLRPETFLDRLREAEVSQLLDMRQRRGVREPGTPGRTRYDSKQHPPLASWWAYAVACSPQRRYGAPRIGTDHHQT